MHTPDYEQAAYELEAAADLIFPYIERLDAVIEYMSTHNGMLPANPPPELTVYIADLHNAHNSGERTFFRHLPIYPNLRDEWITGTLFQFKMTSTEGHRAVMAEKYALLKKCAAIARGKAGLATPNEVKPSHNYYGDFHLGDIYNANMAGAMGRGAHAHDMVFQQTWQQAAGTLNLPSLADELSKLRPELRKLATKPDEDIAVGEIAAAESAARSGNGEKTLGHLKRAGDWALKVATKIGISLATEALKTAIGLPAKDA